MSTSFSEVADRVWVATYDWFDVNVTVVGGSRGLAVVDTHGSAVAGLFNCVAQQRGHTPKPVWNPDLPTTEKFRDQWLDVPANAELPNGFRAQWEEFLGDVVAGRPHRYDLMSAARGVQLAENGLKSSDEGRRIEMEELTA